MFVYTVGFSIAFLKKWCVSVIKLITIMDETASKSNII